MHTTFYKAPKGAEADLRCDTMVQICGAIPPPPPGGEPSLHDFMTLPPPPPWVGNRPDKRGEIARGWGATGPWTHLLKRRPAGVPHGYEGGAQSHVPMLYSMTPVQTAPRPAGAFVGHGQASCEQTSPLLCRGPLVIRDGCLAFQFGPPLVKDRGELPSPSLSGADGV